MTNIPALNMNMIPILRAQVILRGNMIGIGMMIIHMSVTRLCTRTVIKKTGLCGMQSPTKYFQRKQQVEIRYTSFPDLGEFAKAYGRVDMLLQRESK
jgi:hypothetical protein